MYANMYEVRIKIMESIRAYVGSLAIELSRNPMISSCKYIAMWTNTPDVHTLLVYVESMIYRRTYMIPLLKHHT
jgi:hypothetical protein